MRDAKIDRIDVQAFAIPTDHPEADGTLAWASTTIVVVGGRGCGRGAGSRGVPCANPSAAPLCCGRPLYDEGMLGRAKGLLHQIMDTLGPITEDGTAVVGLEPACVATFKDELTNLFPDDPRARRLGEQSFMFSEFLAAERVALPRLHRTAVVHFHCNHHAVLEPEAERNVLRGMELEFDVLDSGCCGMAGSFGFEKEHYEISLKCGERVLLPAVREAARDTLIIADGFSCREQIAQTTERQALHLAQVMQMALREGPSGPAVELPEREYLRLGA